MDSFNLENHPKISGGFKAPDGYFDSLEDRVLSRLPKTETKVVPLFARYRKAVYAAAAILVLSLMVPVYNSAKKPSENIDRADLEHYLAYESGMSQFDLLSGLEPEDLQKMQEQSDLPVSDEEIENALSNNNIEHILTE